MLAQAIARISMRGRARQTDIVFIERLWRSLKYECVYLHTFEIGSELRAGLTHWIDCYNTRRPHSGLDLDPTDQRGVVENFRTERGRNRTLADDRSQFLRDNPPILQEARLRVVAETKNGLHFVSAVWITLRVPNPR
jgi:transposase InsO family protein